MEKFGRRQAGGGGLENQTIFMGFLWNSNFVRRNSIVLFL